MKEVIRRISDKRIKSFEKNFIWFVLGLSFIAVAFKYDSDFLHELNIIVMLFMTIPLTNGLKDLVYILFPTLAPVFRQLKHIGNKAAVCEYILKQEEQKIYEDEVVIITPELVIDKINFENAVLLENIYSLAISKTKKDDRLINVSINIESYKRKKVRVIYPGPYTEKELEETVYKTIKMINIISSEKVQKLISSKENVKIQIYDKK